MDSRDTHAEVCSRRPAGLYSGLVSFLAGWAVSYTITLFYGFQLHPVQTLKGVVVSCLQDTLNHLFNTRTRCPPYLLRFITPGNRR